MEVHAGSIDEEDDEQGIAHMIEHVAFLGSKKREKLLGTGARSNAYTDFHHTVFHIHAPTTTKDSDDLLPSVLDALNEVHFISYRVSYIYFLEMQILDLTRCFI
jgi:predicted Zn-dependent peptidase